MSARDFSTGPPDHRGSVRSVTIEGDDRVYTCEVRTLRGSGMRPNDIVWVEFGSFWTERHGVKTRHAGQWRQCIVLPGNSATSADVHVRVSPSPQSAPTKFG